MKFEAIRAQAQSGNSTPSPEVGASRREVLAILAGLAASVLGGCSPASFVPETGKSLQSLFRERLVETCKVIGDLAHDNGNLNQAQYEDYFVRLLNAVNRDLEKSFGVTGLPQYARFDQLEIAGTQKAAIENGFLITYYPTVSATTGKQAINVMIKAWGEEPLPFDFSRYKSDGTFPRADFSALSVRKFHTVFATPDFPMPVGTVVQTGEKHHSILIDEETIRNNARNAGVLEQALLDDVTLNELGHYVLLGQFKIGASEAAQRNRKIKLLGESAPRDCIEFEEAFSDYCTFRFGATPIDYYILTYPSRVNVGQYALTNEIFLRGLNKAIQHHQADFAAAGLNGEQDWRAFASQLHHDPRLQGLQASIKGFIIGEYQSLFRENLTEVTRQVRGR
ncbi:MAG: hypothetical protein K1X79_13285 [Oligoflexia bacterium]|nr:hypothetical protein [Oligoflexia bacterium]